MNTTDKNMKNGSTNAGTENPGRDTEANSVPSPDFEPLRSAAATYRMFGATPVPLVNSKDEEQSEFRVEGSPSQSTSDQTGGELDWENSDGIGILAGKGGWNGLFVEPIALKTPLFNLRMRDTAWVAQNDKSALIYYRTDASRDILRAVAAIYQAAMNPRFTAAACVRHFGDPKGPNVIPVPPSPDLTGGRWEFLEGRPAAPPPFRTFQVGTEVLRETPNREATGTSKSTPNRSIARNYDRQTAQN